MQMRFMEVDGVVTRCLYAGNEGAYPVLFLHGLTLNAEIWTRNLDALGARYFVLAPDLLGSGFSGPVDLDDRYLIGRRVQHLRKLVDAWGFERFCVCGSSYGGLIGALLYFDQHHRIDKLIINGSSSAFNDEHQLVANLTRTLETMKPFVSNGTCEQWRERLARGFHDRDKVPVDMAMSLMTSYAQPWAVRAWERSIDEMLDVERFRQFRILDRLERIAARTLVVWGKQDPGAKHEKAVEAVARLPSARLETFDECGHFPMLEHPGRYNQLVAEFLQ